MRHRASVDDRAHVAVGALIDGSDFAKCGFVPVELGFLPPGIRHGILPGQIAAFEHLSR
jgi:hypothetical protein